MAWTSTALGLAVGWAAGILAAPYESEQRPFEKIGGVVAAFITGFALSKVDSIFELWIDPARGPMILERAFAYRVLLFATSFILAAVVTYVGRKYVSVGPDAETPKPEPGDRSSSCFLNTRRRLHSRTGTPEQSRIDALTRLAKYSQHLRRAFRRRWTPTSEPSRNRPTWNHTGAYGMTPRRRTRRRDGCWKQAPRHERIGSGAPLRRTRYPGLVNGTERN